MFMTETFHMYRCYIAKPASPAVRSLTIWVRLERGLMSHRCKSCPGRVVPAGSNWRGGGGNEAVWVFGRRSLLATGRGGRPKREWMLSRPRNERCGSRPALSSGKAAAAREANDTSTSQFRRGNGIGMPRQTTSSTREVSAVKARDLQLDAREGQAGPRPRWRRGS